MQKKRLFLLFFLILSLTIILSSCTRHSPNRKPDNNTSAQADNYQPAGSNLSTPKNARQESGQISLPPWSDDDEFKQAQNEHDTPVLLAAYRTVLHDPLPGEEYNVHLAASIVAGTVVQPGRVFSQNLSIGPYSSQRGFREGPVYIGTYVSKTTGGGVCKMASTLYNVAILSNLPVVERYAHSMPVPYVPYGQDATVSYGAKDLKFINNTKYPILIWAQGIDNKLYVGFYGKEKAPRVEWHHKIVRRQPAVKIFRQNNSLPSGEEKVVMQGMDGALIKSWVTIQTGKGETTKQLGASYYSPMPFIIERNSDSYANKAAQN